MKWEDAERFIGLIGVPAAILCALLYMIYRFGKAAIPYVKQIIDKQTETQQIQANTLVKQTEALTAQNQTLDKQRQILAIIGDPHGDFSNIKIHRAITELGEAILKITPEKKKPEVSNHIEKIKDILEDRRPSISSIIE